MIFFFSLFLLDFFLLDLASLLSATHLSISLFCMLPLSLPHRSSPKPNTCFPSYLSPFFDPFSPLYDTHFLAHPLFNYLLIVSSTLLKASFLYSSHTLFSIPSVLSFPPQLFSSHLKAISSSILVSSFCCCFYPYISFQFFYILSNPTFPSFNSGLPNSS